MDGELPESVDSLDGELPESVDALLPTYPVAKMGNSGRSETKRRPKAVPNFEIGEKKKNNRYIPDVLGVDCGA